MFDRRDPMDVLRTSPEGDERAAAMRRLTEPLAKGGTQQEQDEVIGLLAASATTDPSPVVRVAAIDALGRFRDPRATENLIAAYHQSTGTQAAVSRDRASLAGPVGFPPDVVSLLKSRSVEALAQSGRPEALPLLADIATIKDEKNPPDRDTRIAAVRGLGKIKSPDAVASLARVLSLEKTRDPALANRAQEGLVAVTGQNLGDDPQRWDAMVRSGQVPINESPNWLQQAAAWVYGN